jgi:hypothetical protein
MSGEMHAEMAEAENCLFRQMSQQHGELGMKVYTKLVTIMELG